MINNAVLVSGVQQSDSVIYIYSPREEETDDAGGEQDVARF